MYSCRFVHRFLDNSQEQISAVSFCFRKQQNPVWANKGVPEEWCLWVVNIQALFGMAKKDEISHACQWGLGRSREWAQPCHGVCFRDAHGVMFSPCVAKLTILPELKWVRNKHECAKNEELAVVILVWIIVTVWRLNTTECGLLRNTHDEIGDTV